MRSLPTMETVFQSVHKDKNCAQNGLSIQWGFPFPIYSLSHILFSLHIFLLFACLPIYAIYKNIIILLLLLWFFLSYKVVYKRIAIHYRHAIQISCSCNIISALVENKKKKTISKWVVFVLSLQYAPQNSTVHMHAEPSLIHTLPPFPTPRHLTPSAQNQSSHIYTI